MCCFSVFRGSSFVTDTKTCSRRTAERQWNIPSNNFFPNRSKVFIFSFLYTENVLAGKYKPQRYMCWFSVCRGSSFATDTRHVPAERRRRKTALVSHSQSVAAGGGTRVIRWLCAWEPERWDSSGAARYAGRGQCNAGGVFHPRGGVFHPVLESQRWQLLVSAVEVVPL